MQINHILLWSDTRRSNSQNLSLFSALRFIIEPFILKVGQVHFYKLFTNKKNISSFTYIYHYLHLFRNGLAPLSKYTAQLSKYSLRSNVEKYERKLLSRILNVIEHRVERLKMCCWRSLSSQEKKTSENDCSSGNRLAEARASVCSRRVFPESRTLGPDFRDRGKRKRKTRESRERRYETADGRIDDVVILWQKEREREFSPYAAKGVFGGGQGKPGSLLRLSCSSCRYFGES